MLQQDYLMRMLIQFFQAVTRAMEEGNKRRPDEAAEALENAMSEAIDMDANVMLGLEPTSFASIASVSGTDPRVVEYLVRSLSLEATYLDEAGKGSIADLRRRQSDALADAFDIDRIDHEALPVEDLESQMRDMLRADGIEEADLER
ncbi:MULTISPECIES: hypothetical protein [Slackia]|uniref:Uncharacterized protein n=1 Tax=Slackia exigua (strain ATCC 700122 / DSM 15923 / CIP 105133 / JCM 11022 / KCTC 5966 / S-7) TaxID=649764 RepID=D0WG65_SLAES|nr:MULTISPECIES: hypothetical protein [Slackia]MDU6010717.1 hypothetical protein [Slackia sp.]EEZ61478.1 hypothetical protein HMPREF0762_00816 [Slackia exigua ATCC 700122]EJU34897.1 hypothetical protein HMPREF1155_0307 [Slackia sp. CM382]MCK6138752.1 hypothetical protein [Slackia exigua]MDK7723223.1 hypothetical protein [Slackia exigua]